jgi:hypothetical protein
MMEFYIKKWQLNKRFFDFINLLIDIESGEFSKNSSSFTKIDFVKDGKILISYNSEIEICICDNLDYDFILYNIPINNSFKNIIYKHVPDNFNCIPLNYHFIQTNIKFNKTKESIKIHLNGDNYNYYTLNNFINNKFMLYFLKTYYPSEVSNLSDDEIMDYELEIIDNNVDFINVKSNQTLSFGEKQCKILSEK